MNRRERRRRDKARRKSGRPRPEIIPILDKAFANQQAGRLEDAVRGYEDALALEPGYGPALNNLGVALKDLGRPDEAAARHREALTANPRDTDAHYNLGVLAGGQGRNEDARAHYEAALRVNPKDAAALSNLGSVLVEAGDAAEAVRVLGRAVELDAGRAETLNNLGAALIQAGRPDDALEALGRALAIDPAYDEAHHNRGAALMELGRPADAEAGFRRALAIEPGHANAHNNLGILLLGEGRTDDALKAFRHGVQLDPSNAAAAHMVAAITGETTAAAPRRFVRQLFDLYARRFDDHLVGDLGYRIPTLMRAAVDGARDAAAGFRRALDLGCGTGLVAESFHDIVDAIDGVDLSPRMIAEAGRKGLYDRLFEDDLVDFLGRPEAAAAYDLIVAADTLIYIGDLAPAFAAAGAALAAGGLFVFSVEALDDGTYRLLPTGRYAQSEAYIREIAGGAGFRLEGSEDVTVRKERAGAIAGWIFMLRRAA